MLVRALLVVSLVLLHAAAGPAAADSGSLYDEVVDVTGMRGRDACLAMQQALNDALAGEVTSKRVLIKGRLGSRRQPADFTMFHNAGERGEGSRPWPYSVCHAFWPIRNTRVGEGTAEGFPDPLFPRTLQQGRATRKSTRLTVDFDRQICRDFSFDRKQVEITEGRGRGQMRWIEKCESASRARVSPPWDVAPDASSRVRIIDWAHHNFGRIDLHVTYELEIHYRNSDAQQAWQHGVFADVGLHCYFIGDHRGGMNRGACPSRIADGIHRSGRITVHEYGRRDDGPDCAPTWLDREHLTNRPYSVIWQAYGPGVHRGSDDVHLDVVGDGDRDNIGVVAVQTWTRDFRGWRIKQIGTALWIGGSLNDTLYDPYFTGNEFGVVVGANAPWGAGFPRHVDCVTGNCDPFRKDSVSMNFRGGVVEGNLCGNFVMFGGYSGTVDRTFIETGAAGSPYFLGHSVLVGAGVCDGTRDPTPRQGVDRAGMTCGDDRDCGGECLVDAAARRTYGFHWNAALVGNRGSKDWYAFMLGKGTRERFLNRIWARSSRIRVTGRGFGGEDGSEGDASATGLYFFASEGASARIDADDALGTARNHHLPPYDHYVSMPNRDLEVVVRDVEPGRYTMGRLVRRATCTEGSGILLGEGSPSLRWSIAYATGPNQPPLELIEGGRRATRSGRANAFRSREIDNPFLPAGALVWADVSDVRGGSAELVLTLRCWEDGE